MLKNYFTVFFRNLLRQKGYSLINILGLSVGIACSIFVFLWVQDELSYDQFHVHKNQLHLVVQNQNFKTGRVTLRETPSAVAYHLKKDYPEIIETARIVFTPCIIKNENMNFIEVVHFADPSFLKMFTFPLIYGDRDSAFKDMTSIIITERMAKKCFGNDDPLGKTLVVNILKNDFTFKVSGILKNIPQNSSLQIDFLVPMDFVKSLGLNMNEWGVSDFITFVQLQENVSYKDVSKKIFDLFRIYKSKQNIRDIFLHPLTHLHLYDIDGSGGRIVYVRLFSLIALFVLIIACINFVNLATGRTVNRAEEVGIRKVVGARRINLIKQFFSESIMMVLMSILPAIIWVILSLPLFNAISGKHFIINFFSSALLLGLICIGIFTCFAAGVYPALYLSSFHPVEVIKGMGRALDRKIWLRRILVFVQFTISVALIISTAVVYKQLEFIKDKNLGLDKNNIIYLKSSGNIEEKYEIMKNEWLNNPDILNVTISSDLPTNISSTTGGWEWEAENSTHNALMGFGLFGHDYTDTFKISMAQGRFYSKNFSDDYSIVINEKARDLMGLQSPLEKRLSFVGKNFKIIGVVKNFNFKSLHHDIQPLVLFLNDKVVKGLVRYNYLFIRVNPEKLKGTIKYIEDVYKKFNPGYTFEYCFLDEEFKNLYQDDRKTGNLTGYGAFLAIFISCLGLIGLTAFMVEQRTKEIAVRKVFGAPVHSIITLFSRELMLLILMANVLGGLLAYFIMSKWLQGFANRTDLSWWVFLLTACLSFGIAFLMVGLQTIRVALRNPTESLRYE